MSAAESTRFAKMVHQNQDDGVCEINNKLQNMTTDDKDNGVSKCANCGKEGAKNICNKCKMVTYCNAACKKKHRSKHKKACERRVAELHDVELFKQPPSPAEECPICFVRLPHLDTGCQYYSCCGMTVCSGCIHAPVYDNQGNKVDIKTCPFCRTPLPKSIEEATEREKKRMEVGDPGAIHSLGCDYRDGRNGFPQDHGKALELWHRAGELGFAKAYVNIGYAYQYGEGVEVDEKKAIHYYELAAMAGDADARHNLGNEEIRAGNCDRALNHHMIAVRAGDNDSLKEIQNLFSNGNATREDYTRALQSYQMYLMEIKSDQRDKAAAFSENYRYY